MKNKGLFRFITITITLIISISLGTPYALAADGTDVPVSQTAAVSKVDDFKAEVVRLVNAEREKAGLDELEVLDTIIPAADTRAQESAVLFKHTRPDGTRCFTVFAEIGLKYRAAGENLAHGYRTPEALVTAWMNSASHKANLLSPNFKFIGIGYYVNESGSIYCSQLFYTPKSA